MSIDIRYPSDPPHLILDNSDLPDFAIRVGFPWCHDALLRDFTLELAIIGFADPPRKPPAGELVKRFHNSKVIFDYGEQIADFDRVVIIENWREPNMVYILPWATKWKTIDRRIYEDSDEINNVAMVSNVFLASKFNEFGGFDHFRKFWHDVVG